jgi:hypothetical protein
MRVIIFYDRISDFRTLLDLINDIAHERHIPIVAIDREADFERPQPATTSLLKRIIPDWVEQPIDKL